MYNTTQAIFVADPISFEEALKKEEWRNAMKEETEAIRKKRHEQCSHLKVRMQMGLQDKVSCRWKYTKA